MANVLITGCSSGFGYEAAKTLASRGHTVYATMRGVDGKNADVAQELRAFADDEGVDLHVAELDVTSDSSVRSTVDGMLAEAGHIDVVVNNAGQMYVGITEAFTDEQLARQLDINVVGPHRVARAALPSMRDRGEGLIINISSVAGRFAIPFFGVYHASKWGLEGLSESLRYELAPFGVDVVVVEPGPFSTNLFPSSPGPADEACVTSYGDMNDILTEMSQAFETMFEDEESPTDPADVVDRIVELIESSPEERPFRNMVGINFGGDSINDHTEGFRKQLLSEFGLSHLEGVAASRVAAKSTG